MLFFIEAFYALCADNARIQNRKLGVNQIIMKMFGPWLYKKFKKIEEFQTFFLVVEYFKKFCFKNPNEVFNFGVQELRKKFYGYLLSLNIPRKIIKFYCNMLKFH